MEEGRDGRRDGGKRREETIKRKKRALYNGIPEMRLNCVSILY